MNQPLPGMRYNQFSPHQLQMLTSSQRNFLKELPSHARLAGGQVVNNAGEVLPELNGAWERLKE